MSIINLDLVVVGDPNCGKSTLLNMIQRTRISHDLNTLITIKFFYNEYNLRVYIQNISGKEEDKTACQEIFRYADAFILCYSVDNPDSLQSIENKWMPMIKEVNSGALVVVVGNKSDLRVNEETLHKFLEGSVKLVYIDDGMDMATKIEACDYKECSAIHNKGVWEMLVTIITNLFEGQQKEEVQLSRCTVL